MKVTLFLKASEVLYGSFVSQPRGGRDEWIPRDLWPDSQDFLMTSRPRRDPVFKNKVDCTRGTAPEAVVFDMHTKLTVCLSS